MMDWMRSNVADIDQQYALALVKVRGVVFDGVIHSLLLGIPPRRGLEDARCKAALLRNRKEIQNPEVADRVNNGIADEGNRWFHDLEKASKKLATCAQEQSFTLGFSWLCPDCPLWLMTTEAILKACVAMTKELGWTPAILDERLRDTRLRGERECPIRDLDLDGFGKIHGFVVDKRSGIQECTFSFFEETSRSFFASDIGRVRFG
jgi:hypothetical protein